MEILLLIALFAGIFGGGDSKSDKNRRKREAKKRRYHESLGYYEHLYGQGHP